MTLTFEDIEFDNAHEAIQHYDASTYGDDVISLNGKYYVVKRAEAERLEAAGIEFAYVHDHEMPDGKLRTGLEEDKAAEAALGGRKYDYILSKPYRWDSWAAPKKADVRIDPEDLRAFVASAKVNEN